MISTSILQQSSLINHCCSCCCWSFEVSPSLKERFSSFKNKLGQTDGRARPLVTRSHQLLTGSDKAEWQRQWRLCHHCIFYKKARSCLSSSFLSDIECASRLCVWSILHCEALLQDLKDLMGQRGKEGVAYIAMENVCNLEEDCYNLSSLGKK